MSVWWRIVGRVAGMCFLDWAFAADEQNKHLYTQSTTMRVVVGRGDGGGGGEVEVGGVYSPHWD